LKIIAAISKRSVSGGYLFNSHALSRHSPNGDGGSNCRFDLINALFESVLKLPHVDKTAVYGEA